MNTKKLAQAIVITIILVAGLKLYSYASNPVNILKDFRAVKKYHEARQRRIRYSYIKETRGDLAANIIACGDTWGDFGKDIKKIGRDFTAFFKKEI